MEVLTRIILVLTIFCVTVYGHHKHDHDKDKHGHSDHHDKHGKHPKPILPDMARLSDPAHIQDKPSIPNFQEHGSSSFSDPSIPGLKQNTYTNSQWSSNLESRVGSDEDESVGTINNPYHTEWKQESHSSYSYHSPQDGIEKSEITNQSPNAGKSLENAVGSTSKLAEQGINKESEKEDLIRKFSDEADNFDTEKKRNSREVTKEKDPDRIIYPEENDNEETEAKTNDDKLEPSQENDNSPLINKSRDVNNLQNRNSGGTVIVPVQIVSSTMAPVPNNQLSDRQSMPSNTFPQPQLQPPNNINQGMNLQNGVPFNNVMPNPNNGMQDNLYTNQPNGQMQYNPQGSQNYPNNGNSFQNAQNQPLNNGASFFPSNNQLQQPQYFQGQDGNIGNHGVYDGSGNYNNADQNVDLLPAQYGQNNNAYNQPNGNQNMQGMPLPYNNPNGNQAYGQINPSNTGGQPINSFPNNIQLNGQNYNIIPLNNWPNNQNNPQNTNGQYMPLNNVAMNGNQLPPNQGNLIYLNPNGQNLQPNQGNMYLIPQNNLPNNNLEQGYLYMLPLQNNLNGVNMGNSQGSNPAGYQVSTAVPVYNLVPLNKNNNGKLAMTKDEADEGEK